MIILMSSIKLTQGAKNRSKTLGLSARNLFLGHKKAVQKTKQREKSDFQDYFFSGLMQLRINASLKCLKAGLP